MTATILAVLTFASTALLCTGLVLWGVDQAPYATDLLLNGGLMVLLGSPVARLGAAIHQEVRAREWRFAALGIVVLVLLGGSVFLATR